ncbi:MAG: glycerol-3-phosphate dehydrogenase/oxidase [Gammaproteobacteria bacterium]|uniref:Aerobic glycerol-3-phosphate dehydrogenase n=1 Tax=Marinobacter litoralis TaxID=187981 RepID=A0A3M2RMD8_9GAMM|nr:glycerol-3-phosphate dehydrogenase/oxidase [Marinobacter litoralis]MBR9871128.1 glycerol-3-phosphate dehydrogenase/oxidase [Gammaproteobacteria bacterium]RMJ06384.1 Aerobic glycerol-3-phosphate dehydrogenase [Marinobacter litoralis]
MAKTRQELLAELNSNSLFDVVIVGGGITGAGAAREAAGSGLRTLLVEQKDFAWGTSSRSSKMVHGGLRYLGSGHIGLTRQAVRERQRMMEEAPGLVEPLPFLMPHFKGRFPGPRIFQMLLAVYDKLAGVRTRQKLSPGETLQWVPGLAQDNLIATSRFTDAVTDDARLVQRLISEAQADGAICLNYVAASAITRDENGHVSGIELTPEGENAIHIQTNRVINATGAWADRLQKQGPHDAPLHIRPLRGSHLVLPWQRLPVTCAVSLLHPEDGRPVFAFPWRDTTVLGTTDLDHKEDLNREPSISGAEVDYLLKVSSKLFPSSSVSAQDVLSSWAGVRPVVTSGDGKSPSKENRKHALRNDKGLVSVAGGKLTTFRQIAREALVAVFGGDTSVLRDERARVFSASSETPAIQMANKLTLNRLKGFYGQQLASLLTGKQQDCVPGTTTLWAELEWACAKEYVVHLDDLLLRRTRLGLVLPNGAETLLPELRHRCQPLLGWSEAQWQAEVDRYLTLYRQSYSLPSNGDA